MMSDFRYEIKTSLPVIWHENGLKIGVSFRDSSRNLQLILVDPVDDEEIRPRTDLSSVSDFGTGLGSSSSNELISAQLCVKTPGSRTSDSARLSCRDSFAFSSVILSSIKRSRLLFVQFRISYPVLYRVLYRASYLNLYLLNMNLNKGRD